MLIVKGSSYFFPNQRIYFLKHVNVQQNDEIFTIYYFPSIAVDTTKGDEGSPGSNLSSMGGREV